MLNEPVALRLVHSQTCAAAPYLAAGRVSFGLHTFADLPPFFDWQ